MGIILFIVYASFFGWLLFRNPFFRKLSVPGTLILVLFLLKLLAGAGYGYLLSHWDNYQVRADTWRYFFQSIPEKDWLLRDPAGFFADLFKPRYINDTGLTGTEGSLLNDLKEVLIIKFMAICNLLSGNRYYVNLIFFNYLTLFGQVGLAALWAKVFRLPSAKWMLVFNMLWPSVLFWSSGFHRDGLILHCIGWICWLSWAIWKKEHAGIGAWLGLILHFALLFLLRNYLAMMLAAALVLAWTSYRFYAQRKWLLPGMAVLIVALLVLLGHLHPNLQLPSLLTGRQQEFARLEGGSKLPMYEFGDSWTGMIKALPGAVHRVFAQPMPGPGLRATDWPPALENLFWLIGLLPAIWFCRKINRRSAFAWWMLTFLFVGAVTFITGLTIPFVGAITRYKIQVWPFILPPVLFGCWQLLQKWPRAANWLKQWS